MRFSASIKMLTCLMLCVSSAQGIMVKFGTRGGPIEPPAPEPTLRPAQPYRAPAPVWEERSNDTPDPNALWRPQLFNIQPRYTHVVYKASAPELLPLNNAQRFVNSYIPVHRAIKSEPVQNYFTPAQILGSHNLPGVGLRYFVPLYTTKSQKGVQTKQEDAKHNHIETNDVDTESDDSASDLQWRQEKEAAKRVARNTQEEAVAPLNQWSSYAHPRQY